jgi:hypothetical protein
MRHPGFRVDHGGFEIQRHRTGTTMADFDTEKMHERPQFRQGPGFDKPGGGRRGEKRYFRQYRDVSASNKEPRDKRHALHRAAMAAAATKAYGLTFTFSNTAVLRLSAPPWTESPM